MSTNIAIILEKVLFHTVTNRIENVHYYRGSEKRKTWFVVYYESIKRELKTTRIYECRCDERLKTKAEESTHLTYTGLISELEHLKIETRLIDEKFASVMGECVI